MLTFPDPNSETEYTDPLGSVWAFNGTGWVRQPDCPDGGGGGDDPDWNANYVLINGENNPDDPQDIVDATGRNQLTVASERDWGYPGIDTTEFKHGTASIKFHDANNNTNQTNRGRIEVPAPTWTQPWTIEAWVKPRKNFGSFVGTILSQWSNATSPYIGKTAFLLSVGHGSTAAAEQKFNVRLSFDGEGGATEVGLMAATPLNLEWNHCALTWDGNNYRIFTNGALENTYTSNKPLYSNSAPLGVGQTQNAGGGAWQFHFSGWIDDLRITTGVARYTDSFTPPGPLSTRSVETLPTVKMIVPESELLIGDNDVEDF